MGKGKARKGPRIGGLSGVLDRLAGARLCYGEPVLARDRTVIPVARVRGAGGSGWGSGGGGDGTGEGGGAGGWLEATPIGFIEIGDGGVRYHRIPDPERPQRLIKAAAAAIATLAAAAAGAKRLGAGGAERRRLPLGRSR